MLSRVADSLYWMSRYLERVENTARLIGVNHNYILDSVPEEKRPKRLAEVIHSLDLEETASPDLGMETLFKRLTFDMEETGSIVQAITFARENARNVRELISSEMWTQINRLYLSITQANPDEIWNDQPHTFYKDIIEGVYLFQGITDGTMNHSQGWHFIQIARYLERLVALTKLLETLYPNDIVMAEVMPKHFFRHAAALKSVSAFEGYCKVYTADLQPQWVVEFLLFNKEFPRSAAFSVNQIQKSLNKLADMTGKSSNHRLHQQAGQLFATLHYSDMSDMLEPNFSDYLASVKLKAYRLHDTIYKTYIDYGVE